MAELLQSGYTGEIQVANQISRCSAQVIIATIVRIKGDDTAVESMKLRLCGSTCARWFAHACGSVPELLWMKVRLASFATPITADIDLLAAWLSTR